MRVKSFSIIMLSLMCLVSSAHAAVNKSTLAYQMYSKGVELATHKKWGEAVEKFRSAIDLNPSYIASYVEFARSSVMMGKRKDALEKLGVALSIAKRKEDIDRLSLERNNLSEIFYTNETFQQYQNGLNYIRLDRASSAIDALESARKVEPDNLLVLVAYAKALIADARSKDAIAILEIALPLNDRNKTVRLMLAEALLDKNPERALSLVKVYLPEASSEEICVLYARALSEAKKNKEAIEFLREKSDGQPNWLLAQFWLGRFYANESNGGWNARKHLMTFLRRTESMTQENAAASAEPVSSTITWSSLRTEAEQLLTRVNQSLE